MTKPLFIAKEMLKLGINTEKEVYEALLDNTSSRSRQIEVLLWFFKLNALAYYEGGLDMSLFTENELIEKEIYINKDSGKEVYNAIWPTLINSKMRLFNPRKSYLAWCEAIGNCNVIIEGGNEGFYIKVPFGHGGNLNIDIQNRPKKGDIYFVDKNEYASIL